MLKTWKPTAAGIINIVCGVFFLMGSIAVLGTWGTPLANSFAGYVMYSMGQSGTPDPSYTNTVIIMMALACIVPGIVSVLGGIYAIRRRVWGLALAGSISTFIYLLFFGVPAIVFTAISKREFV